MGEVFNTIIDSLAYERLDEIMMENAEYKQTEAESNDALDALIDMLTPEQRKALDKYDTLRGAYIALTAQIAYRQGIQDCAEIWRELLAVKLSEKEK